MSHFVTPFVAGPLMLLILALGLNVTRIRGARQIYLGDGGDPELARAIRAHGNAVEHSLPVIVLLLIYELEGAPRLALIALGAVFVAGRIAHAVAWLVRIRRFGPLAAWLTYLVEFALGVLVVVQALR